MGTVFSVQFLTSLINFCTEYAMVGYFFSPLERRQTRAWLGELFLALLVFPYFWSGGMEADSQNVANLILQVFRLLLCWVPVAGFLWLNKDLKPAVTLYLATFYTVLYTAARNLGAIGRYVRLHLFAAPLEGLGARLLFSAINLLTEMLILWLVRRLVDVRQVREVSRMRVLTVLLVNFLLLYFKYSILTLQIFRTSVNRLLDLFLYPMCATLSLLALVVLFESYQSAQDRRRELEVDQVTQRFQLHSAQHTIEANRDLRELYHDMKNHLLAIRAIGRGENRADEYVDALLERLSDYDLKVSTGLELADAFISEKLRQAKREHILCTVSLDLSPLTFVAPADLIAIFGNAVDNALEAVRSLPTEERLISLRSTRFANTLILYFSNPYQGELHREGDVLRSSKEDKRFHGIGLTSIEKAAQRYNGSVDIRLDEKNRLFQLAVLLSLPK